MLARVRLAEVLKVDEVDVNGTGSKPKFRRCAESSSRESDADWMMVKLYPIPKNITAFY